MLAVVSMGVSTATSNSSHEYWAYISKSPIHKALHWLFDPIPMYINDSQWMPGPYDNWGPLVPKEEVKAIANYTVGEEGPPMYIRHESHCLKPRAQAWLSILKNTSI